MSAPVGRSRRGVTAAAAGGLSVTVGLLAALVDQAVLAVVAGAAGGVAGGLAIDLARHRPDAPDRPAAPVLGGGGLADAETGLFSAEYFQANLATRLATARRVLRPLAVAVVEVEHTGPEGERASGAGAVAAVLASTLREADTACRLGEHRVGILFEDTPEDGAVWTIERLRRALDGEVPGRHRLWAGVASYPTHGLDVRELASATQSALARAREWGQSRIEVAPEV